jgi:hypothetical protein
MKYKFSEVLKNKDIMIRYIKSYIKCDDWKDVYQEAMLYMYIKFDTIVITNIKGLCLNTCKFFIKKYFTNQR